MEEGTFIKLDADDYDGTCRPDINNWIPCVCVPEYMIVMATVEIIMFIVSFILFICGARKNKKKIDKKATFLLAMFSAAFSTHYIYLLYAYSGPDSCRAMRVSTSFVFFLP